jgi:predicted AAA+ superfamily ATPase
MMNKSYSGPETYYRRWLTEDLRQATQDHAVVVLTGARQVGKSTLLRVEQPFADWRFHTLDNYETLTQAREDPSGLWEVQRVPGILSAIKQTVDEHRGRTRFLLSGSANLALLRDVSESLAGRAVYFTLHPMAMGEINATAPSTLVTDAMGGRWPAEGEIEAAVPDVVPLLLRGLMPPLLTLSSAQAWVRWWDGYVITYLERDLRQLSQIDNLVDYRRMMELLALRSGQVLNQSELARDAGLSQATAHRHLNLLESTYLFERLPAYSANRTRSLVKSPKSFWNDPALAAFLSGLYDEEALRSSRKIGSLFETWIYHHLRVLASLMMPPTRLYFWRERNGQEVDFVVEHGRHVLGIEVKLSARVGYGDTTPLRRFLDGCPEACGGIIVYGGTAVQRLSERIVAVPWPLLTG